MQSSKDKYSLLAKQDFEVVVDSMAITVEFKKIGEVMASQWWVTGITKKGRVALFLQLQLSLKSRTEDSAISECKRILPIVKSLAVTAKMSGGLSSPINQAPNLDRSNLAKCHLRLLDVAGIFQNQAMDLAHETALRYELCNALGVSRQVELIAAYLAVPVSTVQRRLAKARDVGYLPKKISLPKNGGSRGN
jgi:hypothetical protein